MGDFAPLPMWGQEGDRQGDAGIDREHSELVREGEWLHNGAQRELKARQRTSQIIGLLFPEQVFLTSKMERHYQSVFGFLFEDH